MPACLFELHFRAADTTTPRVALTSKSIHAKNTCFYALARLHPSFIAVARGRRDQLHHGRTDPCASGSGGDHAGLAGHAPPGSSSLRWLLHSWEHRLCSTHEQKGALAGAFVQPTSTRRLEALSARNIKPGGTTIVALYSVIIAGPR